TARGARGSARPSDGRLRVGGQGLRRPGAHCPGVEPTGAARGGNARREARRARLDQPGLRRLRSSRAHARPSAPPPIRITLGIWVTRLVETGFAEPGPGKGSKSDEAVPHGEADGVGAVGRSKLPADRRDVGLYGLVA